MATRDECRRALELYQAALLAFRNVLGVRVVPLDGPGGSSAEEFAVGILVSRKIPYHDIDEDDVLPSFLQLIDPVTGVYKVPTRVLEERP